MCVDLLPGEQCFLYLCYTSVLLPEVQCCIIAWTSIIVIMASGWVSCAVILGCCIRVSLVYLVCATTLGNNVAPSVCTDGK